MNRRDRRRRFSLEPLEMRLALSGSAPANVIGTSTATVSRPHEVSQTSVQVAPKNILALASWCATRGRMHKIGG